MARPRRLSPTDLNGVLEVRFRRQRGAWFSGEGTWPLSLPLGVPSEQDATRDMTGVRRWVRDWEEWRGPGEVVWTERRWSRLGVQRLPERVAFSGPEAVADVLGLGEEWRRALSRRAAWLQRWPDLAPILAQHLTWFMEGAEVEESRMVTLLTWLRRHPQSGLYPRQLPVPGLDSKWLEGERKRVRDFLAVPGDADKDVDFYGVCGLRRPPARIRLRVLDGALRGFVGGLSDFQASVEDVARLTWQPSRMVVVENVQTGLAFDDLPGTVLIMGLGYGVDCLGSFPWCVGARCQYWGDIDTHGFAILDRARAYVPELESILMDEATLLAHESLWVREQTPHGAGSFERLEEGEHSLYRALKEHRYGANVRLEQERIDWAYAWSQITASEVSDSRDQ